MTFSAWDMSAEGRGEEDYYRILGVEDDASPEEIRSAYRDLVRQYQPDAGLVKGTSFFFRQIQRAYEVLSDPQRRQEYDERLRLEGKRPPRLFALEVLPGPAELPCVDEPQLLYLLITLTPLANRPEPHTRLNLCLVIDCSTSMQGERLAAVREAVLHLVEQLQPDDILSLVAFSDFAQVLLPPQHAPHPRALRPILASLTADGGTEIFQGLEAGLSLVGRARSDHQINHLVLLTDGHTYGDAQKCLLAARSAARQDIGISAFGVGHDWNEDFLDHLTTAAGGQVVFIENPASIGRAFLEHLRQLKEAWITDLTLRLYYAPAARFKAAFALTPELRMLEEIDGELAPGNLHYTRPRHVLVESIVSPLGEGTHRVLQVEAAGMVPAYGISAVQRKVVRVPFRSQGITRPLMPAAIVEAAQKVSLLRLQKLIEEEMRQGRVPQVTALLEGLATRLMREGQDELAGVLVEEARLLAETGRLSPAGAKRLRFGTRALQPLLPGGTE
ncbi:MAG: DnaJ domain-containing protein [Anaerolineae bacterium]